MSGLTVILIVLAAVALAMVAVLAGQAETSFTAGGKMLAFFALFLPPGLLLVGGAGRHYQRAQTTEFCRSCHIMRPYGDSLYIDDSRLLPAAHYQNNRIPANRACYACHTEYAMFGDVVDKLRGVRHVRHYFWGTAANPIQLYKPYSNRACLECHQGARSYEENSDHVRFKKELLAGSKSCLMCHTLAHEVDGLARFGRWHRPEVSP